MNRHQSNPFLAGWEMDDLEEAKPNGASAQTGSCADLNFSRDKSSVDGWLLKRNMSSFEAASLQLEHQQQMNSGEGFETDKQIEMISKMTADFQSAIDTNDKQFDTELFAEGFNAFDPFETIVDDDMSLPSTANPSNHLQASKQRPGVEGRDDDQESKKVRHDSIDDDDDELVSTPVRNIKSSASSANQHGANMERQLEETGEGNPKEAPSTPEGSATANSIEKAFMFATLLASAESSPGLKMTETVADSLGDESKENRAEAEGVEQMTRIIKGSPQSRDGNIDRPISYFDPFETVFDKDALTSLMSESNQEPNSASSNSNVEQQADPLTTTTTEDAKGSEKANCATNQTAQTNEELASSLGTTQPTEFHEDSQSTRVPAEAGKKPEPSFHHSSAAPANKTPKKSTKKKSSFQEDSSDSSEDDDRIQIVIKAKDKAVSEKRGSVSPVPLLPPPPSKSSMKQARERGQVEDVPNPVASYRFRDEQKVDSTYDSQERVKADDLSETKVARTPDSSRLELNNSGAKPDRARPEEDESESEDEDEQDGAFVIRCSEEEDGSKYAHPETPLYDEDTSYVLEEYPARCECDGWDMMLRYPPKKKLTSNRFWKKIYVRLAEVPVAPDTRSKTPQEGASDSAQTCIALQIYAEQADKKPMQEIPIQATYTVSEISNQQLDQFGKIFTIKLQYIFYKERVGVRQGQLARFIHTGHIGSSTTSGGHGVDPISIGAIKRVGAPIEHSPQISQIIKLGCTSYEDMKQFKNCLEDYLFRMPICRSRALSTYKTEEVQMAVRDETYIELNQIGTITKQLARVRLFFLSFLNGNPTVEVGINAMERQGREIVGRMDILPVVTEEWIRLEAWELHSSVEKDIFEDRESRLVTLVPPDATFFELMRFRVRPPRNRELPLQISANMSVTRTKVDISCEVMVPGCVSRKHGQIPCENIAIRIFIPECWIYFFREEKHFRMGSKKSVNRRPGKVKGIERFLGGGGLQDMNDESSLIEVTSGQAKYEHHHHSIVWRAARWPKESQSAYVHNTMKIRLPLTAYDKMPEDLYDHVHVEYTMPATTVSHTTLRSISVNPYDDEPPEKYVKYSAKYEYKVKMRQSINFGPKINEQQVEASPIVIMKQPDVKGDLQREEDSDASSSSDDDDADAKKSAVQPKAT